MLDTDISYIILIEERDLKTNEKYNDTKKNILSHTEEDAKIELEELTKRYEEKLNNLREYKDLDHYFVFTLVKESCKHEFVDSKTLNLINHTTKTHYHTYGVVATVVGDDKLLLHITCYFDGFGKEYDHMINICDSKWLDYVATHKNADNKILLQSEIGNYINLGYCQLCGEKLY